MSALGRAARLRKYARGCERKAGSVVIPSTLEEVNPLRIGLPTQRRSRERSGV